MAHIAYNISVLVTESHHILLDLYSLSYRCTLADLLLYRQTGAVHLCLGAGARISRAIRFFTSNSSRQGQSIDPWSSITPVALGWLLLGCLRCLWAINKHDLAFICHQPNRWRWSSELRWLPRQASVLQTLLGSGWGVADYAVLMCKGRWYIITDTDSVPCSFSGRHCMAWIILMLLLLHLLFLVIFLDFSILLLLMKRWVVTGLRMRWRHHTPLH